MNHLGNERSPYLLQHAGNPVDWMPWGEEAFAKARAEQKPIFLSIGYSTCHWCHVMAHESFEDPAIAALLNEGFVPVKVDREERPDVDRVYMTFVQTLTGHGGWPLSAWLTPELKPFYGGTYFPPEDRPGRAGFPQILRAISRGWTQDRATLVAEGERMIAALRSHAGRAVRQPGEAAPLEDSGSEAFENCFQQLCESFDSRTGGFGGAPKFPRASNLSFLFRVAAIQGVQSETGREAVRMAAATLQGMARGGIHDHVGGGFHRYSVDGEWFVPHFEKMLYDQGQIACNAIDAYLATGDTRYSWLARDILEYVARDLTAPEGAFYSAEDADSAPPDAPDHVKVEGAFYVWTKSEIATVLSGGKEASGPGGSATDTDLVCAHLGIRDNGNVPAAADPQGELAGRNVLVQRAGLAATAAAFGMDVETANERLLAAIGKLRAARSRRARPHLDDKIVTAWNGLMISALARAHMGLGPDGDGSHLAAAKKAAEFLRRESHDESRGILFRSYREGSSGIAGFAEDYAFLIQGLLDLYEASFDLQWLKWAERLQRTMDALFWDDQGGGYFNSAAADATIIVRLKENYDGAEPAPSSVAAMNLLRLGAIFDRGGRLAGGEMTFRDRALGTLQAFSHVWSGTPHAMPQMLCALELALQSPRHVVLAGDTGTAEFRALASALNERLGRHRTVIHVPGGDVDEPGMSWLLGKVPWLEGMGTVSGRAAAYVCEDFTCRTPLTDPGELRAIFSK